MDPDLPARVCQRFRATCAELKIDPALILKQFNRWHYPERDLLEMESWTDSIVVEHCRLLAREVSFGTDPYPSGSAGHGNKR